MAGVESVRQLDAILRPRSVAVTGASTAPGKLGHEVLKNIRDGGFQGPIYPINPKAESILNLTCYPGIKETPDAPDLAVVIVPARMVPQAVQECGERGVRVRSSSPAGSARPGPRVRRSSCIPRKRPDGSECDSSAPTARA